MNSKQTPYPASDTMLAVKNDGPHIVWSNFWANPDDNAIAMSANDSCFRLLVSERTGEEYIREIGTAERVIVTRPRRYPCKYSGCMLDLMFEGDSAYPFTLLLDGDDFPFGSRLPGPASVGRELSFKMYTGPCENPKVLMELPAYLRIEAGIDYVPHLPRLTFREVRES